ncbi:hypothetical protein AC068_02035 [Morganella morganii]|uniref:T3SS regulon anti-activator ExsD domain-containing protein n=1 Tax=Morganella morganii TaxID=582 RepID=UPI0006C16134|nr:T3SS regulon anti-activator ExsD domain-containing protein [Morganella morganii]KOO20391.1 hypothetical protein AC068_02035 [Morganella morganii]MBS9544070.1 T3SS regulon anti-activator ExsD family protein [Morganella morganii subsp. morganii]
MLNKTKDTAVVSDTDAYVFYEKYNENDLLSKYIHRENIDKLKKTAWFSRRKKWNIPFRHSDLVMIRKAICQHPSNWELHLADTIRLSESRCWVDWIITGAYEYWQNKNHSELITLRNTYDKCLITKKQLSALVALYKDNDILAGQPVIDEAEHKLSECEQTAARLENEINTLQQSVLFSIRDLYDAFRATVYHNNTLKHDHFPDELQIFIDSLLLLKENNNERVYQWLYQRNLCLHGDTILWY